jgi:hypothetical protein
MRECTRGLPVIQWRNVGLNQRRYTCLALRDYGTVDEQLEGDPLDAIELDMSGRFVEFNFGGIAKIRGYGVPRPPQPAT